MLARLTSRNQLTLPKSVTNAVGAVEYFEVQAKDGQIILTPVRIVPDTNILLSALMTRGTPPNLLHGMWRDRRVDPESRKDHLECWQGWPIIVISARRLPESC